MDLNSAGLQVVVLYPIVLEAYSLVLYRLGGRAARRWLREIQDGGLLVNPTPEDYAAGADLVRRFDDQAFSLFDTVLAVASRRLDIPIWTFDHHFEVMRADVWRGGV